MICSSGHAERIFSTVETYTGTSALVASWRRCLRVHRLHPDRDSLPLPDRDVWSMVCEREGALLDVARPALETLLDTLGQPDSTIVLTDRRGMILDLRSNRAQNAWKQKPEDWLGATCSEEQLGTTMIGMCLADQRTVIVRGDQHYLTRLTDRAGIAAPLFGPDGGLVGSLSFNQDAASHDARLDTLMSLTVSTFARRIEAELFARAYPRARLVLASSQGRTPDAVLAVDHDDRVVGATRGARRLLSLADGTLADAPNVDDLLDATAAGRADVLAEAERRTIVRALSRVGGNLSAAARLVGISRSTLYRKLAAYEIGDGIGAVKLRPSA